LFGVPPEPEESELGERLSLSLLSAEEGRLLTGRVCEDLNRDGRCQDGEPGVEGITLWSEDGQSVAVSDGRGEFVIRLRDTDEYLRVIAPSGYRSAGKVLARPNAEVAVERLIAAASENAGALTLANLAGFAPLYGLLAALIGAVLVGNLQLGGAISALRRQQRQAANWSAQAEAQRQRTLIEQRLAEVGPNAFAAQLVSDVLRESLGTELFVVGLSPSPAPHIIFEGAGRRLVFTVNPGALKRAKLIGRWAISMPLAEGGALANLEAQLLWEQMVARAALAERPVVPRNAEWYLVVDRGVAHR